MTSYVVCVLLSFSPLAYPANQTFTSYQEAKTQTHLVQSILNILFRNSIVPR